MAIPARSIAAVLEGKRSQSLTPDEIKAVAISFADYISYDFIPGWSGDERAPDKVVEFVENVVEAVHIRIAAEERRIL